MKLVCQCITPSPLALSAFHQQRWQVWRIYKFTTKKQTGTNSFGLWILCPQGLKSWSCSVRTRRTFSSRAAPCSIWKPSEKPHRLLNKRFHFSCTDGSYIGKCSVWCIMPLLENHFFCFCLSTQSCIIWTGVCRGVLWVKQTEVGEPLWCLKGDTKTWQTYRECICFVMCNKNFMSHESAFAVLLLCMLAKSLSPCSGNCQGASFTGYQNISLFLTFSALNVFSSAFRGTKLGEVKNRRERHFDGTKYCLPKHRA